MDLSTFLNALPVSSECEFGDGDLEYLESKSSGLLLHGL